MAATITYDRHSPTRIGDLAIVTGTVSLTTATAGVDFKAIEQPFNNGKVYCVLFENSVGYTAEYYRDGTDQLIYCFQPNGTVSNGAAKEFRFTAIGQGG